MTKANLNTDLAKLKDLLPRGGQKKIAEKTGYTRVYVCNILNGTEPITEKNISIIEVAQKLIESSQKEIANKMLKLNKFLSEQKA